jgi:hypothetical protein
MGAPKKNPPQGCAAETRALAATGYSKVSIASYFGTSFDTFQRWCYEFPEIQECFAQGRETERLTLHNALYIAATQKGQIAAAMFLLKARHSYRENDVSDQANKVNITFNLPGAMTPEQFKTLEGVTAQKSKRLNDGD